MSQEKGLESVERVELQETFEEEVMRARVNSVYSKNFKDIIVELIMI